jgi:hypothetical protein
MIELEDWLKHVKNHSLLFRFKGVPSRGRIKDAFHASVGEACAASDSFMDDYMYKEYKDAEKRLDAAIVAKANHDELLSGFCEYLMHNVTHAKWVEKGLPTCSDWESADIDTLLTVIQAFPVSKEDYLRDWVVGDASIHWKRLEDKDQEEYLLKEHPPEAVLSHAYESAVDIEDVFFVCPSCHGEPQTEDDLTAIYGKKNGYPMFHCGSCGGEMCVGKHENILDFFNALNIIPYPFNQEKQKHWLGLMAARKASGENKLEIKVGDLVYLEACEPVEDGDEVPRIRYKGQPGELVRCTGIHEKSMSYECTDDSGDGGGITWDHVWAKCELEGKA